MEPALAEASHIYFILIVLSLDTYINLGSRTVCYNTRI